MVGTSKNCCSKVVRANSARRFLQPAQILKRTLVTELLNNSDTILEVGAGGLRNAAYLLSRGHAVTAVDCEEIERRFSAEYKVFCKRGGIVLRDLPTRGKFDLCVITFVIETMCRPRERMQLLTSVRRLLRKKGALVLSVRGPADLVTARAHGIRCSDGYITPLRTFARSYSRAQLNSLLVASGYSDLTFLHRKSSRAPEIVHVVAR